MAVDPTILVWPDELAPHNIARRRVHPVNFGPEPIDGAPQSVVADAGRFQIEYNRIGLFGDSILTFRAIVADLTSPLKPVYVPLRDYPRTPRVRAGAISEHSQIHFSDGQLFSDGSGFAEGGLADFTLVGAVAARATTFTVVKKANAPTGLALTAGNIIGLGDRAHIVTKVSASADSVPSHFDVTVWPYLREAWPVGSSVETENPILKCTIDPKMAEVSETLDVDRIGSVDVHFSEMRW